MSDDWRDKFDKALARMGRCVCKHTACEHWHYGTPEDPQVFECDACECRNFRPLKAHKSSDQGSTEVRKGTHR
jgi:hypothetical protein